MAKRFLRLLILGKNGKRWPLQVNFLSTFEDGGGIEFPLLLEVKARSQPFPFLLLSTDGNFFLQLYWLQKYIRFVK